MNTYDDKLKANDFFNSVPEKDYYYSIIEYAVFNYPKGLEEYSFCRIELQPYGNESHIWLHPNVSKGKLERLLNNETT